MNSQTLINKSKMFGGSKVTIAWELERRLGALVWFPAILSQTFFAEDLFAILEWGGNAFQFS